MWDENELIKLWEQGFSGTEIAYRMGTTRNAVLGKIHRLREKHLISRRPKVSKPRPEPVMEAKKEKPKAPPPPRKAAPKRPTIWTKLPKTEAIRSEPTSKTVPVEKTLLTLFDLKRTNCRYIVEMDTPSGALYCGDPMDRASYCKKHADLCYYKLVKKHDDSDKPGYPSINAKWQSPRTLPH
jgi:hypothetical protein